MCAMGGDMHIHTTFSDGTSSVEDVIRLASAAKNQVFSICDHDTMLGITWAWENRRVQRMLAVPGIEMSAWDTRRRQKVHLLVYYPNPTPELRWFCAIMAQRRTLAATKSMQQLKQAFPLFDIDRVNASAKESGVVYRTHILRELRSCGYTDELTTGAFFPIDYLDLHEVLSIAHGTNGVVVMAHPGEYNGMMLAHELLKAKEIDGVEADTPKNTQEQKRQLIEWALQYEGIYTGGTDFHGLSEHTLAPLGSYRTKDAYFRRIRAKADNRGGYQYDVYASK